MNAMKKEQDLPESIDAPFETPKRTRPSRPVARAKRETAESEPFTPTLPPPDPATPTLDVPGVVSIPLSEIKVSYARSSGPGGQNVNKTSSKAQIRWNLVGGRLAPDVVERFRKLYPSYVTEKNEVVISNQEFRDAPKNRQACFNKLCAAILAASKRPKKRIPTKPTPGSIERRLDAKKRLSAKKKDRSKKDFD